MAHVYLFYRLSSKVEELGRIADISRMSQTSELENLKRSCEANFVTVTESLHRAIFEFTTASRQIDNLASVFHDEAENTRHDCSLRNDS